ncbi:MAG: AAA family ATPase [Oscillospiraceae bacterium]|nr:AAA family ATPase [Oscillospiraceae bacterium]
MVDRHHLRIGLLGQSLKHSYSPQIHAALSGAYSYELFEVEPGDLENFMQCADWHGINVTIPYKQAVVSYCDELSKAAKSIGSVNTIVRRADGSLYGDNTDAAGFALMLQKSGMTVSGSKALVLGSGGSSLAVSHMLRLCGAREVVTISRRGENNYENIGRHANADVLINTTPLGMYPNVGTAAVDMRKFPNVSGVLDIVYNPARTALMLDAEVAKIQHICGGLPMLIGQAARAAEIFTEQSIANETVDAVLRDMEIKAQNIIIIGMPGSGKSTIARTLAQQLGRPLIDTDTEVTEAIGMTPGEMIQREGEDAFRARETEVLARFGKQTGLVIATGGGVVTREENYRHLRQNGVIVFLERPVSWLARKDRPLSQGDIYQLHRQRLPMYRRFANATVKNDGKREVVAEAVLRACFP